MRTFETGATRDTDDGKLDFEAHLSPLVLVRYSQYLTRHANLPDGTRREPDNWQKGIPKDAYMKSMLRHVIALWGAHRGHWTEPEIEESLCAILFNASGYLHELLRHCGRCGEQEVGWPCPRCGRVQS